MKSACPVRGNAERIGLLCAFLLSGVCAVLRAQTSGVRFASPGFPPSLMDGQGCLVEDWGTVRVSVSGEGLPLAATPTVEAVKLDGVIPAAQARSQRGPIALTTTAYRAPAWPAGVDVLSVCMHETAGREARVLLSLDLPEGAGLGATTVSLGGKIVMSIPESAVIKRVTREWGWCDDAVAMPGWGKPEGECDPAFRSIRAGMGGAPIRYRFTVERGASFNVVLGLCESHWDAPGQRPVVCNVEGAPSQEIDPLARWGRHKPGALLFSGRDADNDGWLEVSVMPCKGAPDHNPILNVIWIFPPGQGTGLQQVISGKMNASAVRYVDVGGATDQCLYASGKFECEVTVPASGAQELNFLVACQNGAVPIPDRTAWTVGQLRKAALDVWRDWKE